MSKQTEQLKQKLARATASAKALRAKAGAAGAEAEYWETLDTDEAKENTARLRAEAEAYTKAAQEADKDILKLDRELRGMTIGRDLREAMAMTIYTWSLAADLVDTQAPEDITLGTIADIALENGWDKPLPRGSSDGWRVIRMTIETLEEEHEFSLDSDAEEKLTDRVDYLLDTARVYNIPPETIIAPKKEGEAA